MPSRKTRIKQAEIVERFAARLKELRRSRGLTQAQLAQQAQVTAGYVARLEAGRTSPGIDLVARLAAALGISVHDWFPSTAPTETVSFLQQQARKLADDLITSGDRETLLMLCPLLARLGESPTRRR
jgi:transcriptional regulator with XRE-family HTH domain